MKCGCPYATCPARALAETDTLKTITIGTSLILDSHVTVNSQL